MTSRTRQRRAGTAYLEALGVSLVFILLFAFALRFARSGHAQLERLRAARADAWADALRGCEPAEPAALSPAQEWATFRPQAARALLERSVTRDASALRATTRVLCNEPEPAELGEREATQFLRAALAESEAP